MAAKNARLGNKRHDAGRAADADSAAADIAALIDGDDPGAGIGPSNESGGDHRSDVSGSEADGGRGEAVGATGAGTSGDNRSADNAGTDAGSGESSRRVGAGKRAASAADSQARDAGENVSRRVSPKAPPKKTKTVIEEGAFNLPDSSKELIGDLYSVMFWIAGQVTLVPEWQINDEEADLLGERTEKFVKSLGKKRASNLMKTLGKIGPPLGLVSALAMVTVPRVKLTMQRNRVNDVPQKSVSRATETEGSGGATDAAPASDLPTVEGSNGNSPTGLRPRPFAAGDFAEIVPGYGREDARVNLE